MENIVLEMAKNLAPVLGYMRRVGIIYIRPADDFQDMKIFIKTKLFRELFPDAKEEEDGWAEAMYNGVKIAAMLSPEATYEEAIS